MNPSRLVRSESGMTTSLLEAVLVIAIVAIIATGALVAAMRHIEDARISRAMGDAKMIGLAIHTFMQDTGFAPIFKSGTARGPEDEIFRVLQSDGSDADAGSSLHWPTQANQIERLENQLIKNQPAETGAAYPRRGEISYARFRGWNGPYVPSMPSSDPWGDRYLVNVQLLSPKGIQMEQETLTLGTGQRPAVFVLSPGANRRIETRFDQIADTFAAGGDDVVYRIQ